MTKTKFQFRHPNITKKVFVLPKPADNPSVRRPRYCPNCGTSSIQWSDEQAFGNCEKCGYVWFE